MDLNKIKTDNQQEQVIIDFLIKDTDKDLQEKIKICSDKNLNYLWGYLREKAQPFVKNNIAIITDETVFGWAKEYFFDWQTLQEEKQKKQEELKKQLAESKPVIESEPIIEPKPIIKSKPHTLNLFDLLEEEGNE